MRHERQISVVLMGLWIIIVLTAARTDAQCKNVLSDARLNNSTALDCGAPVVLYELIDAVDGSGSLDIYAIGGGRVDLVASIPSITYQIAPPARDRTLIEAVGSPGSGQVIAVYLMLDGELVIETAYADGKPYVIRFDPDGGLGRRIRHIAW